MESTGGANESWRYFAYGSNMSAAQMAARCPGAIALGAALLDGWELKFDRPSTRWGGFVADIVPLDGAQVWGVLWQVTSAHLEALDRFEGVANGAYRRVEVSVNTPADHALHSAQVYVVCLPENPGLPSGRYLEVMVAGAEEHRLPTQYIHQLRRFATA
jgi:gamma-glutamylcyclotransferase (GGCT)/AIG2-like uncharacterized protein YtfP